MAKIEIKDLTKKYGETVALAGVSLTLEENKIYGLLGRNGAGKTTLLNLLGNKIFPTQGEITVDDQLVWENSAALSKIYYMVEETLYPDGLRIRDLFKWTQEFYPDFDLAYACKLADEFELDLKRKFRELSTGYTTIAKAIVTLASQAEILLFDEPILGLDANHRDLLYREILANYSENPKTIVISTHLIDEVADILEEVIIIEKGQIILTQSVESLLEEAYTISGSIADVNKYLTGKKWVGEQTLRNFKRAIVLSGSKDLAAANSLNLEIGTVELQKLFIGLTGSGRRG